MFTPPIKNFVVICSAVSGFHPFPATNTKWPFRE